MNVQNWNNKLLIILSFISIFALVIFFIIPDNFSKISISHSSLTSSSSTLSLISDNAVAYRRIIETKNRSNLWEIEAGLAKSRALIKESSGVNRTIDDNDPDYVPSGSVYWNPNLFHRNELGSRTGIKFLEKWIPNNTVSVFVTECSSLYGIGIESTDNKFMEKWVPNLSVHYQYGISLRAGKT